MERDFISGTGLFMGQVANVKCTGDLVHVDFDFLKSDVVAFRELVHFLSVVYFYDREE